MTVAIHPSERVAEELRGLEMSAAELAGRLSGYGLAASPFFRHQCGVLAEFAQLENQDA